jgi:hypothetical protein
MPLSQLLDTIVNTPGGSSTMPKWYSRRMGAHNCVFSLERCMRGTLPVEEHAPDPTAGLQTLYGEQERRKRVLGWQRTHKDPFEGEWEQIMSWLVANPER